MQNPIGIDFGTNYCRNAYLNGTSPKPIPNQFNEPETAAWVYLSANEQKPIVGRHSKPSTYSPTKIPLTQVKNRLAMRDPLWLGQDMHTPAEVASWIIQALLRDAEKILAPVDGAIASVPALAGNLQKVTMLKAFQEAGVTEVHLITEPTAAVIAHHKLNRLSDGHTLVYSLGAGYFEVAVIENQAQTFKTLSVEGNKKIGGNAFNLKIRDYILGQLFKKHKIDLRTDAARLWQLEDVIEQAKIDLSSKEKTDIRIPNSADHSTDHFTLEFTRPELEKLLDQSIEETLRLVQQALDTATLSINDIDHILLVGGSTRIPLVQQRLQKLFNKKPILAPLDIIAQGAAWQTAKSIPAPLPSPPSRPSLWEIITDLYLKTYLKIGSFLPDKFLDSTMEHTSHQFQTEQNEKAVILLKPLRQKIQEFLAEIYFIEGRQLLENEEWIKAKQVLEIALTYNPKHIWIRREVWHLYLRDAERLLKEKDGQALLDLMQRSQEIGLSDKKWPQRYKIGGHTFYGESLAKAGEWAEAMTHFEKVIALDPSGKKVTALDPSEKEITERIAECYMNIGEEFFENEQWREAIEYFEKILKLYPSAKYLREKTAECYMNIAEEFFDKKQWQEAIEYFEKVFKRDLGAEDLRQKIIECYMNAGEELYHEGDMRQALFHFKMGQIYDPTNNVLNECVKFLYSKMGYR